ncbi:MAG: response regulator transcription factor, partial [Oscillospiraceae bacterium]
PFGVMELISRIKAVLRRGGDEKPSQKLSAADILIDDEAHSVTAGGENISLTLKEYSLLLQLVQNKGRVLTRDALLQTIWGYNFDGETRTVDVHIRTLRNKLGKSGEAIETIRGVGYRIGA